MRCISSFFVVCCNLHWRWQRRVGHTQGTIQGTPVFHVSIFGVYLCRGLFWVIVLNCVLHGAHRV